MSNVVYKMQTISMLLNQTKWKTKTHYRNHEKKRYRN